MSKRKWRRGPKILSLDELVRQDVVFWSDKPQPHGWFMSWQFRMAANSIGKNGVIFYAMPADKTTRFSDEDVVRAERRMRTPSTLEGRRSLIEILNTFDRGHGDVDDVIDEWEDDHGKGKESVAGLL